MAAPRAKVHARPNPEAAPGAPKAPMSQGSSRVGQPNSGPPGRGSDALRSLPAALGALLALAVLLLGVPALLWYGTDAVLAMGGVDLADPGALLTGPDNGQLFLWALVGIGWIGWFCFVSSVLLEIPAQLRGRVARRIPAFGWSQRMAAGLVGAVIALLPVAGASFAATVPRLPAATAPAQLAAAPRLAALTAGPSATPVTALQASEPQQQPTYTVRDSRPADSLWSIAERQLGSGDRWQEIAKLNDGRVMDGSGTRFDADRPIQPGWQLLMPADAKPDGSAAQAATPAPAAQQSAPAGGARPTSTTVRDGDTLSAIAQRELGSSDDWPQLFDANKGVQAPDGERLTDPNVVVPGMVLTIPGAQATPAPAAPAPAAPAPAAPAPAPAQAAPAPAAQQHDPGLEGDAHPAGAPGPSADARSATPAHPRGGRAQVRSHDGARAEDPSGDYTDALAVSGVGVLLAAVLIGAVAHRRGAQQRARRPRRRIPLPAPPAAVFESELKTRQNNYGLDLLNRALRTMARNVSRTGKRLPALAAVRVTTGGTVELHLAVAAAPIAPFRAAHTANIWWCTADSDGLLTAEQAARVTAPYPALVTLGTAADGAAVLADLETARLLHLSGQPEDARDVLRTIALELAHSPLADRLNLHLVGFADDLPVSDTVVDRVHRYASLEAALDAVGPRTDRARATLVAAGATHPRDARSRGQADEAWVPEIVLSVQSPGGELPAELGRLLDGRPRTCLAVVTRAPERGAGPVARWTLPSSGPATLPGLNLQLQLQRLTDEQYAHWTELLHTSGSTEQRPAPDWTLDGDELDPSELPVPVPVLAGVGASDLPFIGAALPEGLPESGPRLIARVVGTGSSPFATADPAAAPCGGAGDVTATVVPVLPAFPLRPRHALNGRGLQASQPPVAAVAPVPPAPPVAPVLPVPLVSPETRSDVEPATDDPTPTDLVPTPDPTDLVPTPDPTPDPIPEPLPTHDTAPALTEADPGVPSRPEPAAPAPLTATTTPVRSDADDLLAILRSPEAHAFRAAPRIRLLGPVDVLGAIGPAEQSARPGLTELAAYLALHPGATPEAVDRALHPGDHARPDQPLPASLDELAGWLGNAPDGRAFLRQDTPEGCAFAPTVTCDWDEFRSLYRRGMRSTSSTADAALAHALALVRGAPFAETPATAYGWAEADRQDMLATVVDTAHELAARRLQYGDHRNAEAAVFRGLAVAPDVELLHRDLFYAYASAGARDQLLKAVNRLDALSRRTGRSLDPDTVSLLRDLLSGA
ncbi:LysM peptidoglycan-binding domain-containing protein [Kitasatospora sp. NPDC052896]|uniref:LysM peptidoglycan-binding domain-containing protein n=1 Tax=Kitasatospora sp. NPDC052896 TaxID=3364061 RepID=UPI0037C5C83B